MHLINTTTHKLEHFIGGSTQPYAILSHTWDTDEVTFADLHGKRPEVYANKAGFDKIQRTCAQAKEDGLQYAWVDTCCINNDSSAELSEAINSMCKWYKEAAVCYAYVADFREPKEISQLRSCRWFYRGWTLQELLAPKKIIFYGAEWTLIGTKGTMLETLQRITGVPAEILSATKSLDTVSVAARMSWAANRRTTRVEDIAYCLLGLFDVHMPLLYGEGTKAFLRLQDEIMRQTKDESLFAWCADNDSAAHFPYRGLYASSPAEFADCGDMKHFSVDRENATTVLGNGQISLNCSLKTKGPQTLVAIKCYRQSAATPLAIEVSRIGERTYLRSNPSKIFPVKMPPFVQDIIFERYAERQRPLAAKDVHWHGSIYFGEIPDSLRLLTTIPFDLPNSSDRRISQVDALEAGKVSFRFEVPGTNRDIFLIFWVHHPEGDPSDWYLFDVVPEPAPKAAEQNRPRYRGPQPTWREYLRLSKNDMGLIDSKWGLPQGVGKPRQLADCQVVVNWVTVKVSLKPRVVEGNEVMSIDLSTTINEKMKQDWLERIHEGNGSKL